MVVWKSIWSGPINTSKPMAENEQTNTTPRSSVPSAKSPSLPADAVPVVPIRTVALLPGMVSPLTLQREFSIAAAQEAVRTGQKIAVLAQRDPTTEKPAVSDLYQVGVLATVLRYVTAPDGAHHLVCQGESRIRIAEVLLEKPFFAARIEQIEERDATGADIEGRVALLKQRALQALALLPQAPREVEQLIAGIDGAGQLADLIASFLDI